MLTTKEAIERRRSIRKYKPDPVADDILRPLLDAARLAPSGCNAQPWRFRIVKDDETKRKLARAAHNQSFIATAPVVLVCCADIRGYPGYENARHQPVCRLVFFPRRELPFTCFEKELSNNER